tara:strand:+ start:1684 stop:2172 length:489 start_codon:yes stop_codon:yes gene_type:complete
MKSIKEKKASSKIMSIYWFAILFLVAGVIVYMVSIFYGNPYDVREIESNILINNVANCLSENGKLKDDLTEEIKNDFLKKCSLNFNTNDDEGQYYLEVEFLDFGNRNSLPFKITEGNINLKDNPNVGSIFKSEKSFYILNNQDEEIVVKILAVISKTKENVG